MQHRFRWPSVHILPPTNPPLALSPLPHPPGLAIGTLHPHRMGISSLSQTTCPLGVTQSSADQVCINRCLYPVKTASRKCVTSVTSQDSGDDVSAGFGQLHPRSQGITTLGTIYSSSVFPNRAPQGQHLVLNFIGGATNRGILKQSHEDLVAQVLHPPCNLTSLVFGACSERTAACSKAVPPLCIVLCAYVD